VKLRPILLLPLALLGLLSPAGAQQLILNGGFELPVVGTTSVLGLGVIPGSATFVDGGTPNNGITDWSVTQGTVSVIDNGGTVVDNLGLLSPYQGNQYAVLNSVSISALGVLTAGGTGTLQQTFNTTAMTTYQVSFASGGVGLTSGTGSAALQTTVFNSSGGTVMTTAPNSGLTTITTNGFMTETFDFVATSATSTLSFDEPAGSLVHGDGVGLDGVSVTAVPEPAQYAAAAVSFLLLLIAGRLIGLRRAKNSVGEIPSLPAPAL
jgi:hypothetical protein